MVVSLGVPIFRVFMEHLISVSFRDTFFSLNEKGGPHYHLQYTYQSSKDSLI